MIFATTYHDENFTEKINEPFSSYPFKSIDQKN